MPALIWKHPPGVPSCLFVSAAPFPSTSLGWKINSTSKSMHPSMLSFYPGILPTGSLHFKSAPIKHSAVGQPELRWVTWGLVAPQHWMRHDSHLYQSPIMRTSGFQHAQGELSCHYAITPPSVSWGAQSWFHKGSGSTSSSSSPSSFPSSGPFHHGHPPLNY